MKKNNMLTGTPWKSILVFAGPMIIGNLLQQFYNMADTIIVGRFIGKNALSATGSMTSVINIYTAVAIGLSMGCMIAFSQLFGARRYARMKTAMYTASIAFLILSAITLAVSFFTTESVLSALNTPAEILSDARTYYMIYMIGYPATYMFNIGNYAFNSLGKSKVTLMLLAGSSVLNVLLDLWFVIGLKWGVAGAAVATVISQYIIAVIMFALLLPHIKNNYNDDAAGQKKNCIDSTEPAGRTEIFDLSLLGNMAKVAVPAMISQVICFVGYAVLQARVNLFGINVMAGYIAGCKIDSVCAIPMIQIGNAMATYTGQNVGANTYERIPKGLAACLVMDGIVCVIFSGIVHLFSRSIIGWFITDAANPADAEAAITAGSQYICILAALYFLMGAMYVMSAVVRGAGDTVKSVFILLCNFGVRCVFAYIMADVTGSELAIWWSNPLGWFIGVSLSFVFYISGGWKKKRLADKL